MAFLCASEDSRIKPVLRVHIEEVDELSETKRGTGDMSLQVNNRRPIHCNIFVILCSSLF